MDIGTLFRDTIAEKMQPLNIFIPAFLREAQYDIWIINHSQRVTWLKKCWNKPWVSTKASYEWESPKLGNRVKIQPNNQNKDFRKTTMLEKASTRLLSLFILLIFSITWQSWDVELVQNFLKKLQPAVHWFTTWGNSKENPEVPHAQSVFF